MFMWFVFFWAFRAPGWPETDSPRKIITKSGVETRIRALGTRFVAIFRFRKICDVDYNLSSKNTTTPVPTLGTCKFQTRCSRGDSFFLL